MNQSLKIFSTAPSLCVKCRKFFDNRKNSAKSTGRITKLLAPSDAPLNSTYWVVVLRHFEQVTITLTHEKEKVTKNTIAVVDSTIVVYNSGLRSRLWTSPL